jgi:hypothetical protein
MRSEPNAALQCNATADCSAPTRFSNVLIKSVLADWHPLGVSAGDG